MCGVEDAGGWEGVELLLNDDGVLSRESRESRLLFAPSLPPSLPLFPFFFFLPEPPDPLVLALSRLVPGDAAGTLPTPGKLEPKSGGVNGS